MDKIKYPKDPRENLIWRSKILKKAQRDPILKESLKRLFYEDIVFAFNVFFFTYDPRPTAVMSHLPFATYPFQDDAILDLKRIIEVGEDVVWEKCRDMGATWMICLVMLWFWLSPKPGNDFLLGSRKEMFVDDRGNMSSLFPKLRYVIARLPKWLVPKGYDVKEHDNKLKLINPATGSVLTGESNNVQFSTGGRYKAIFYDEFSKWKDTDAKAWTSGAGASLCRIAIGTPFGVNCKYYDLVTSGITRKITLRWPMHPLKSKNIYCVWPAPNENTKGRLGDKWKPKEVLKSPWYVKESLRYDEQEMDQEINLCYIGSGNPVFSGTALDYLMVLRELNDNPVSYYHLMHEDFSSEKVDKPLDRQDYLVCYTDPNKDHEYVIAADIVEGTEDGDYACVIVYDRNLKSIAATYYSRLDEVLMARIIKIIAILFTFEEDYPWVAIETTGPGLSTFDKAVDLDIPNLFMAPRYDVVNNGVTFKKGWRTDSASKRELISGIKEWLIDEAGAIHSQRLIGEMLTFIRTSTGKARAKKGAHDDMVMAFGIAIQVDQLAPSMKSKPIAEAKAWHEAHIPNGEQIGKTKTVTEQCNEQIRAQNIFNRGDDFFW